MLYLHIGTNKAGSTTIQRFIASDAAAACGLRMVRAAGGRNARNLAAVSRTPHAYGFFVRGARMTEAEYEALPTTLWRDIADEIAKAPDADYVMSSEFIYACYRRDEAAMTGLRDRLTDLFGELRILFYCRDQLDYLRSSYAQGIKGNLHRTVRFAEFLEEAKRREMDWDYHGTLSVWERAFGRDALRIRVLHPDYLTGGDLLPDFLDATRRPATEALNGKTRRAANVSPPRGRLEAIRYANRLRAAGPAGRRLYPLARRIANRVPPWLLSPLLPPEDEALRHAERFYATNAAFNAHFLLGQPDRLPLPPGAGMGTD